MYVRNRSVSRLPLKKVIRTNKGWGKHLILPISEWSLQVLDPYSENQIEAACCPFERRNINDFDEFSASLVLF